MLSYPLRFRIATALMICALTVFTSPSFAEDEKPSEETAESPPAEPVNPGRFAPDFCDFEITFPEKPAIAKKCIPDGGCYDVYSYTMVYDLQTTVDISASCNPSTPAAYKRYNESVMKAALAGMVESKSLTSHETRFQEYETTKSGSLTGVGTTGQSEKIYSAQLWVGPNSIFTVQAELIGGAHDKADQTFRDILQSIKGKEGKQLPKPKKAIVPKQNNQ